MERIKSSFLANVLQPQHISLILITLILIVFSIVVYLKVKKQDVRKAPKGIVQIAEMYVMSFDKSFKTTTDGKMKPAGPYLFTLFTFLMLGNIIGLLGFDPPSTSYSVTFTLGIISWLGIYVVGIVYKKIRFFKKYLNPIETAGQFAPLISLSFRLFGNMIAGSIIIFLVYKLTGWIWHFIPVIGKVNLLGPIFTPFLHLYFDIFDGLIQAYVFMFLTMIYWTIETEVEIKIKKDKKNSKIGLKFFKERRK